MRDRARPRLSRQESLERLVEALDLAAGLWVIEGRVDGADAQTLELALQEHLAAARCAAEDRAVVAEQAGRRSVARAGLSEDVHDVGGLHRGEGDRGQR